MNCFSSNSFIYFFSFVNSTIAILYGAIILALHLAPNQWRTQPPSKEATQVLSHETHPRNHSLRSDLNSAHYDPPPYASTLENNKNPHSYLVTFAPKTTTETLLPQETTISSHHNLWECDCQIVNPSLRSPPNLVVVSRLDLLWTDDPQPPLDI